VDDAMEGNEVLAGMDGEMEQMEEEMIAAKRRSEGMRAQCVALRAQGARHDFMLGLNTITRGGGVLEGPCGEGMSIPMVPKLNLAALGEGGTGRLGHLMNQAKKNSARLSPRKSSARSSSSHSSKSAVTPRKSKSVYGHTIVPVLPTIDAPDSSDSDSDTGPMQPLSHAALTARSKTKIADREKDGFGNTCSTPPHRGSALDSSTHRAPSPISSVSLGASTARCPVQAPEIRADRPCGVQRSLNNTRKHGGLGGSATHRSHPPKGNSDTDLDVLLADLSV